MEHTTCQQPDRDAPKLKCGYPLPCPYHTAIIDGDVVILPPHRSESFPVARLKDIAQVLKEED